MQTSPVDPQAPEWVQQIQSMPGLSMRRTADGAAVVKILFTADPDKCSTEWILKERKKYSNEAFWRKEMLVDYEALSGQRVYPEYDPAIHVIPDHQIPREGCIFMSVDPHPRTPHAFLWVLIDRWGDWYVYRELWPSSVYGLPKMLNDSDPETLYTIKEYVGTVAALEGNRIEWYHAETDSEYGIYRGARGGEKVSARYMDQAGKGFKASAEAQLLETYAQRYARYGMTFLDPKKSHHVGEDAVRQLLKPRKHDTRGIWPRLHIGASCAELQLELANHRYKVIRSASLERDLKQEASEYRTHMIDNLRYLATANIAYWPSDVTTRYEARWLAA